MCVYSTFWIEWEKKNLAPFAVHSEHPWYAARNGGDTREHAFDLHGSRSRYRTVFELDKDRITNSQAFRRLEYKTQVFVTHEGDNYRTRLTHTLEVAEVARHIARALRLNEHLVEAIALGHDLGHAPYGHVSERAINEWIREIGPPYSNDYFFCHNRHSVENVDHLEPGYDWDSRTIDEGFGCGLKLTNAVREGILVHTTAGFRGCVHREGTFDDRYEDAIRKLSNSNGRKGMYYPGSLEAQVVRLADDLTQVIHDLEDGIRSNILRKEHICELVGRYVKKMEQKLIDPKSLDSGPCFELPGSMTKVSKLFLLDIIETYDGLEFDEREQKGRIRYDGPAQERQLGMVNQNIKDIEDYRMKMVRVALVAYLLHMWRDDRQLSSMTADDQERARTRILKYLYLLNSILGKPKDNAPFLSTYHVIAFLRGIMLASAIEHSHWNINTLLDDTYPSLTDEEIKDKIKALEQAKKPEIDDPWYLVFVVVSGLVHETRKSVEYEVLDGADRFFCFEFDDELEMEEFVGRHYRKILASNGSYLRRIDTVRRVPLKKLNWLHKSDDPSDTGCIVLEIGGKEINVGIEQVRICFTGYRELCPGMKHGACSYARTDFDMDCAGERCPFHSTRTSYPDIQRIIEFQQGVHELFRDLKDLIRRRIHSNSRVARMNYMGRTVVGSLLRVYLENPRLMHDRVLARMRSFANHSDVSPELDEWLQRSIVEKEDDILSPEAMEELTNPASVSRSNWIANRYSLIRRIVEHVAGMTDRYLANEYNRINECGREVELQDETYFFS